MKTLAVIVVFLVVVLIVGLLLGAGDGFETWACEQFLAIKTKQDAGQGASWLALAEDNPDGCQFGEIQLEVPVGATCRLVSDGGPGFVNKTSITLLSGQEPATLALEVEIEGKQETIVDEDLGLRETFELDIPRSAELVVRCPAAGGFQVPEPCELKIVPANEESGSKKSCQTPTPTGVTLPDS